MSYQCREGNFDKQGLVSDRKSLFFVHSSNYSRNINLENLLSVFFRATQQIERS